MAFELIKVNNYSIFGYQYIFFHSKKFSSYLKFFTNKIKFKSLI